MWGVIVRGIVQLLRSVARLGPTAAPRMMAVSKLGRISFAGLIRNRPLATLTQQEIRNSFAQVGLREAHNSHFISRLIERGSNYGIHSLDDFARLINNGTMRVGAQPNTVEIVAPGANVAVVVNQMGHLITFLPL